MKKLVKLISVVILAVLMCLSFCSCKELDEMRDRRAYYGKTEETLYFRKAEYKLLPKCRDLNTEFNRSYGHITEKDVPILLADTVGKSMFFDEDAIFISSSRWDDSGTRKVWCRADLYDEMAEKIENYTMDRYCFSKYYYDEKLGDDKWGYPVLSEELSNIITNTLLSDPVESDGQGPRDEIIETFLRSDETATFIDSSNDFMLIKKSDGYYIMTWEEKGVYFDYKLSESDAALLCEAVGYVEYTDYSVKE